MEEYYKDQFTPASADNVSTLVEITSTMSTKETQRVYRWIRDNDPELWADMIMFEFFHKMSKKKEDQDQSGE